MIKRSYLKSKVSFYPPEKGGRSIVPIGDGYAPYLRAEKIEEDLPVRVNGMPLNGRYGTPYDVEIELSYHPELDYSVLTEGSQFEIVEGPKIVGEGTVTSAMYQK